MVQAQPIGSLMAGRETREEVRKRVIKQRGRFYFKQITADWMNKFPVDYTAYFVDDRELSESRGGPDFYTQLGIILVNKNKSKEVYAYKRRETFNEPRLEPKTDGLAHGPFKTRREAAEYLSALNKF